MTRAIVLWPDPVLDRPTREVTDFAALPALLAEMEQAMREAEGIGIAANQVGVDLRVALVGREDGTWFEIVNPTVVSKSEPIVKNEGCLSVPGEWHDVKRVRKVRVRYQDRTGEWHELDAEDRLAHVLQHEIDHLDGHVYVHHLSALKRKLIRDLSLPAQGAIEEASKHHWSAKSLKSCICFVVTPMSPPSQCSKAAAPSGVFSFSGKVRMM